MQKLISLIGSHLFIFAFISITLGAWLKERVLWFMSENVFPVFTLWCLSHISVFTPCWACVCAWWETALTSLIHTWLQHTCWRDRLFPTVCSCLLRVSLFWALLSVPLIHVSVSAPVRCCFCYCSFVVASEVWESCASCFVGFFWPCSVFLSRRAAHCGGFPVEELRLSVLRLQHLWCQAQSAHCIWDLLRTGIEPVSPALQARVLTAGPPEKPYCFLLFLQDCFGNSGSLNGSI